MGFFDPGWKNRNKDKALRWISRHKGSEMVDAIITSNDRELREAAMSRLILEINTMAFDSELILMYLDLIRKKCDSSVFETLVQRIINPAFLKTLAEHGCTEAICAIRDQDILYQILTDTSFFKDTGFLSEWDREQCRRRMIPSAELIFAEAAFEQFDDLSRMPDVLKNTTYEQIAGKAARAIHNPNHLMAIIEDPEVSALARRKAISALTEEKDLINAVERLDEPFLKREAIERITTPEIRKHYCETEGTHKWELVDTVHHESGDHDYMDRIYQCVYCGKKKTEEETYVY